MTVVAFWSEVQRLHIPAGEVWLGVRIPGTEVPERVDLIHRALLERGLDVQSPHTHAERDLAAVHDPDMVRFLSTAWDRWVTAGYPVEPGMDRVVPYVVPARSGRPPGRIPTAISALTGMFATDTMTLIGPGTWEAARAAADCALTAADHTARTGATAYAACRPPGHHAGRAFFGGSCYLNNAALAAQRLIDHGLGRVAVIDLDAHHGNGTQDVFWDRDDVWYGSVHVDPAHGWYPHFVGHSDEVGEGPGHGATKNIPLVPGTDDEGWLAAVEDLAVFSDTCEALVVSLGVDAAVEDPESPLAVSESGFARSAQRLARLDVPTVVVQEGGYHLPTLGRLVLAFLEGLED